MTDWAPTDDLLDRASAGVGRQRLRMSRAYPPRDATSDTPIAVEARSRGVAFHALGHDPPWTLEILPDRLEMVTAEGAERVRVPAPAAQTGPSGDTVYAAQTEAHRVTVRIRAAACRDARSGLSYPSTVDVQLNVQSYRGCGQWLR